LFSDYVFFNLTVSAVSVDAISAQIKENKSKNTLISDNSVWKQFKVFCEARGYKLEENTSVPTLANILKDWGFNMKRCNGEDYKEAVFKTMWNKTAKLMQDWYYNKFSRVIDPFKDVEFKSARDARNTKRKILQKHVKKGNEVLQI
jgi:hypothetical protein